MLDVKSNLLKRYPKNRKKLYPDLSLLEVLKLKSVREYISETTVNRYLEFFSGFFHWSVQADFMLKNPRKVCSANMISLMSVNWDRRSR